MRTLVPAALFIALLVFGCEDDPEDLDYLKAQDAGSETPKKGGTDPGDGDGDGDGEDAGSTEDSGTTADAS